MSKQRLAIVLKKGNSSWCGVNHLMPTVLFIFSETTHLESWE